MDYSISKKKLKDFGILLGFGIPLIFGLFQSIIFDHEFRVWTLIIGFMFLSIAFIKPSLLKNIYKIWMFLGLVLGWINSRIILGFIFIFVLFPISFLMRIFGYDPLNKKYNNNFTYKENVEDNKVDLKRIF